MALSWGLSGDPGPFSAFAPPCLGGMLSVVQSGSSCVSISASRKGIKVYTLHTPWKLYGLLLLVSHWLELSHEAISGSKGGWEV